MLHNFLTIYLSGAAGLLFIGTRLPSEVRLASIVVAALIWPIGMSWMAWRNFSR
jgi:hypothetical protein